MIILRLMYKRNDLTIDSKTENDGSFTYPYVALGGTGDFD